LSLSRPLNTFYFICSYVCCVILSLFFSLVHLHEAVLESWSGSQADLDQSFLFITTTRPNAESRLSKVLACRGKLLRPTHVKGAYIVSPDFDIHLSERNRLVETLLCDNSHLLRQRQSVLLSPTRVCPSDLLRDMLWQALISVIYTRRC
jgi:hypothetical protein